MRSSFRIVSSAVAVLSATLAGVGPAQAVSSTSSAVSESFATSVGSVSDSFRGSSRSSRPGPARLAAGEFRVVEVAAGERAGRVQLKLEPTESHGADSAGRSGAGTASREGFTLELPERALARTPLATGDRISVTQRPFGVEFSLAATREAFFLVLDDDWYRELAAKPLV